MVKTYEVDGETLIERTTEEVVKNYNKESLKAEREKIDKLLAEYEK